MFPLFQQNGVATAKSSNSNNNSNRRRAADIIIRSFQPFFEAPENEIVKLGKKPFSIPKFDKKLLMQLFQETTMLLMPGESVVTVNPPYYVVGDIHGNLHDLLRIISEIGKDPSNDMKIVFLGDYVDRGGFSLEVILLLFTLKNIYPENIILLRGNHEFAKEENICFMNTKQEKKNRKPCSVFKEIYDFYGEEYSKIICNSLYAVFDYLPLACCIGEKILLLHGGIAPKLNTVDDLRNNVKFPLKQFYDSDLITDILWSDPCPSISRFSESPRGYGQLFGQTAVDAFFSQNPNIEWIIRGHQCVDEGVEQCLKGVVTVFSSSFYDEAENSGGFLYINSNFNLKPTKIAARRAILRKNAVFVDVDSPVLLQRKRSITMSSVFKLPNLYTSGNLIKPQRSENADDLLYSANIINQKIQEQQNAQNSENTQNSQIPYNSQVSPNSQNNDTEQNGNTDEQTPNKCFPPLPKILPLKTGLLSPRARVLRGGQRKIRMSNSIGVVF